MALALSTTALLPARLQQRPSAGRAQAARQATARQPWAVAAAAAGERRQRRQRRLRATDPSSSPAAADEVRRRSMLRFWVLLLKR